jgi:hypothetical protein
VCPGAWSFGCFPRHVCHNLQAKYFLSLFLKMLVIAAVLLASAASAPPAALTGWDWSDALDHVFATDSSFASVWKTKVSAPPLPLKPSRVDD